MVCRRRCGGDGVVEDAFDEVGAGELLDAEVEEGDGGGGGFEGGGELERVGFSDSIVDLMSRNVGREGEEREEDEEERGRE